MGMMYMQYLWRSYELLFCDSWFAIWLADICWFNRFDRFVVVFVFVFVFMFLFLDYRFTT